MVHRLYNTGMTTHEPYFVLRADDVRREKRGKRWASGACSAADALFLVNKFGDGGFIVYLCIQQNTRGCLGGHIRMTVRTQG